MSPGVPFTDLAAITRDVRADVERAWDRLLSSNGFIGGDAVEDFEQAWASYCGVPHAVGVGSGTDALLLTLLALRIGPGDEVIVPSFTFAATANSVRLTGAMPVFADIDPATFNLDPDSVAALVGPRTAAIMPVHLYGQPADLTRLSALAERHGLQVIEDAAQAHGAEHGGRPAGTFGQAGCFSFYPTKNMHALEGGMVVTPDAEFARTIRLLRNQGMERQYANEIVGYNVRMTDVAAAIGRVQLGKVVGWNKQRRANAATLDAGLSGIDGLRTPAVAEDTTHVYHQYTVRVEGGRRDALRAHLTAEGVGSGVYYPTPTHLLPPFAALAEEAVRTALPETDRAADEVLSLPVHPTLGEADLARIVEAVRSFDFGDPR